ncbi:MAG: hypothetical protein LBG62_00325 [Candidatus Methanoplasma sp.]|jgi:hypothetical protein|nr:hypothetical protein [Candidatus Methanoplasma sp.]
MLAAVEEKRMEVLEYYRGGKIADYDRYSKILISDLKDVGYLRSGVSLREEKTTIKTTELGLAYLEFNKKR